MPGEPEDDHGADGDRGEVREKQQESTGRQCRQVASQQDPARGQRGHERGGDLILGGLAAVALEDGAHEAHGIGLRARFHGGEIGGLLREDVRAIDERERLGGK